MTWNPQQYLLFAGHRLRPAVDLLARIGAESPRRVADLGCGAGNVTRLLHARWPEAQVTGYDNSPEMLDEARAESDAIEWRRADLAAWAPDAAVDVIYSNAALHWIPDHAALFARLVDALAPGGWLAVQMPQQWRRPSHVTAFDLAKEPRWRDKLAGFRTEPVLPASAYYDMLAPRAAALDIWETEYLQALDGENPIVAWTKGSFLAQLLAPLDPAEAAEFEAEYARRVRDAYPPQPDGRVLFPFRRLFIVARI